MSNHECPCCSWHLINGVCGACGQVVETKEFAPQLPVTPAQVAPQLPARPFGGMCEVCGTHPAVSGMYECEECLLRMAKDLE